MLIGLDQRPDLLAAYMQLATGRGAAFPAQTLRDRLGDCLDLMLAAGAVQRGRSLSVVSCTACFEGHTAEVEYDPISRRSCFFCAEAGRVELDDRELETVLPNLLWLPDQIARALNIKPSPPRRTLIEGAAWLLGDTVVGSATVSLALALGVRTTVESDLLLIGLRSRKIIDIGVLLVSGCALAKSLQDASGYLFIDLGELVQPGNGVIEVNRAALAAWVRSASRGDARPKSSRGRPGLFEQVRMIHHERSKRGKRVLSGAKEAQVIWQEWLEHFPDQDRPGLSTVRRHLKSIRSGGGSA